MPRPRTITDDALLEIARRCFLEHGHTLATRDIAQAAGISQAILYQRFGDKRSLFLRAMTPAPVDPEALLGAPNGAPAHTYLREVTRALVRHLCDTLPAILHLATYPGAVDPALQASDHLSPQGLGAALASRIRALADTGAIAPASPEATAHALLAMAHSLAMRFVLQNDPQDLDADLDAMFGVLWYGLQPRF